MAPNRIAIYLTALAGIATALLPTVTDLGLTQVAAVLGGLLSVTAVALKFLDGHQTWEKAGYQGQLAYDEFERMKIIQGPPPVTQSAPSTPASKASALKLPR